MHIGLHVKCPLVLFNFLDIFSKSTQISNCMKIPPGGAELFYADRQTDMTNLTVAFRNFAEALKNLANRVKTLTCYPGRRLSWLSLRGCTQFH